MTLTYGPLFLCALTLLSPVSAGDNPLSKVFELLDSLSTKIKADGEVEEQAYREFFEWCDEAARNLQNAISSGNKKKEDLEAEIAKCTGDAGTSASMIEELASAIGTADADLAAATKIRKHEADDFKTGEAELSDTIDTLSRAVNHLTREMNKNPAVLAQMDMSNLDSLMMSLGTVMNAAAFSGIDTRKIKALIQEKQSSENDDEAGAPAGAVYTSKSGNFVEILEDMKEKAEEQLSSLRKAEVNAKHNFDMLKQSLQDQLTQDNKDMASQKDAKTAADGARATAEGDLTATVKDLAQSNKALDSTRSECMTTAADHEATVRGRKEELSVIAKAKKNLQESTGGAEKQAYDFLQVQGSSRIKLAGSEVVAMIKKLSRDEHSLALAQLASRMAATLKFGAHGGDPFSKVKRMIQDLISKLEAEAEQDATEKAFCDEQMGKTTAKKEELDAAIEKLTTKIDKSAAASTRLKGEVRGAQSELAALAKTQAEMDSTRADENAAYKESKNDLENGLQGVRKALSMLRDYYGGDEASLLQSDDRDDLQQEMEQPAKPEQHKKSTGAGQSIVDLLEVCESDFASNLAQEETEEADAAGSYEQISQENAITKATLEQDVKYKTQEFTGLDKRISELTGDRDSESSELIAVMEYFSKIKDRCVAKPETYEERKKRREAEIAGLQEALRVLSDETAFLQRSKRNLRNHRALSL